MSPGEGNTITGDCWLAYFDILGFKSEMAAYREGYRHQHGIGYLNVLAESYQEDVLRFIEGELGECGQFAGMPWYYAHFSDTFVFYSPGDPQLSYLTLESVVRHFFLRMLLRGIAPRGAITRGEFYANRTKDVFIGPALVAAYNYAERQDWIGYVLTPRACHELAETDLNPMHSVDYAKYNVPIRTRERLSPCGTRLTAMTKESLLAFRICKYCGTRDSIRNMKKAARSKGRAHYKRCRSKYINTLRFMKQTALTS